MTLFQYAVVASILHDERQKRALLGRFESTLAKAGGEPQTLGSDTLRPRDDTLPLFIFVLTGGTEAEAMELIVQEKMLQREEPVVLLAHPSQNSLPAAFEILAKLRQDGGKGTILQADTMGIFDEKTLGDTVAVSQSMRALRASRIGVVGRPSDWLIASHHDPKIVRGAWGPELRDIPFEELSDIIKEVRAKPQEDINLPGLREKAEFYTEADEADMRKSMEILCGLQTLVVRYELTALTLRCFDLVLQDRSTGCLALSALADEGIDAGCEGDIPSIIGLHWMRTLTGQTGWMANPSRITIQQEDGGAEALIAHCTAPCSILSRYGLRSHFESGLGVAIAGIIPAGDVTLVRIGGKNLERVWFSPARVIASPRQEGLCRTQAVLRMPLERAQELLTDPLGNHLVMVRGDWTGRISAYLRLWKPI
jgi:L-fucose isomerase-like protein